jgi:cell division protein FtsB
MELMGEIRRRARHVAGPMLMVSVAVYFGYHAVEGDRGLIAWRQVTQHLKSAETAYAAVHAEREALERRVALLGADRLDPDLLDERAHIVLGFARPDEVEILDLSPGAAPPPARGAIPSPQPGPR